MKNWDRQNAEGCKILVYYSIWVENSQKYSVANRQVDCCWKTAKGLLEQCSSFSHNKYSEKTSFCYSSGYIIFCYVNQPDYRN